MTYEAGYVYGNWVEGYDKCNVIYTSDEKEAMKHYSETQCNYLIRYNDCFPLTYEKYYDKIGWQTIPMNLST